MINDFHVIDYDIGKSARQESVAAGPKSIKHLYSIAILICFHETHTVYVQMNKYKT